MSDAVAVGLDVGTSALKGVAVRPDGTVAARASASYGLSTPRPGWSEQDPEDWWQAAESVLASLARATGGSRFAGIGLSGQMHGLVSLDAADRVIRPAILWNDARTGEQCEEIERTIGREALIAATGNRALAGFTAPKLLWLREHEPDSYARIRSIMLPKDYVRLRLCGERATDVADASGTLLLDVGARAWSDDVLSALSIDPGWLPALHESPAVTGATSDGVPVAAGAGDQAAGALGVGVLDPGPASVVLGTSGVVFAPLAAYAPDPDARAHVFCHAAPGTWHAMGVTLSAAGSLAWLAQATGGAPISELLAEAARWPPGVEGLTFLPYLAGERTPHGDPDARGSFTGLSLRHDRGALVRAVLEGVACSLRDALDVVSSLGPRPSVGRVSGGGAASDLWLRIVATALDLPLQRMASDDGAALGAAMLGGVAGGLWRDLAEAVGACVRVSSAPPVEPVAEWAEPMAQLLARYRALYPALRALIAGVLAVKSSCGTRRLLRAEKGVGSTCVR